MNKLSPLNDININIFDEIIEERFSGIDTDVLLVISPDNVPSEVLPHLAEQYHIMGNEGWLFANSDEEKKALIKSAINIHRYKGTKYSLIKVLELLKINGIIQEWFEYGGEPYYFKIVMNVSETPLSYDRINLLFELINEYKNERSWLEAAEIILTSFSSQKTASFFTVNEKIVCMPRENL